MPAAPTRRPGLFVVDPDGAMIGLITLDRRDAEDLGHVRQDAGEVELGYLLLRKRGDSGAEQWLGVRPSVAPSD